MSVGIEYEIEYENGKVERGALDVPKNSPLHKAVSETEVPKKLSFTTVLWRNGGTPYEI